MVLVYEVAKSNGYVIFKQQSVSVKELSVIVAPWKFDVLKTNICQRSEASRANMLVLRTSNFQGATISFLR